MATQNDNPFKVWTLGRDVLYLWRNHVLSIRRTQGGWQLMIELPNKTSVIEGFHLKGLTAGINELAKLLREHNAKPTQQQGFRYPHRHTGKIPEEGGE